MSKVILRPLAKDAWSGVVKYKNCYEDIGPYLTRSGIPYSGLSDQDRVRLGEKLSLDLSPNSEFWHNFNIRTMGKDIILNTEDPMDELKYLYLRFHKNVKESIFAHKATANFVLVNQEEESKKTNLFNRIKREASREFDKMTSDEMKKALRLFGKSSENTANDIVENKLYDIVEGDPAGFLEKWVHNKNRDTQYIVERAVSLNVIRKNKRVYSYGSDVIGNGIEEVIGYLNDPKNQEVRMAIMSSIEGKKSIDHAPVREYILKEDKGSNNISLTSPSEVKAKTRTKKDDK